MRALIVDALGTGRGIRRVTVDVIGAGPRTIGGVLQGVNIDVQIMPVYKAITEPKKLGEFDMMLVSAMTGDLPAARKAQVLWKKYSGGPNLIGGPLSSNPHDALIRAEYPLAVIGEGEEALEELLKKGVMKTLDHQKLAEVKGIAYRDKDKVVVNQLRPAMSRKKYNSYTPSVRLIRDYPLYFAFRVYVEVLRGCSNYYRTTMKLPNGRKCHNCGKCKTGPLKQRYDCPLKIPPGCGYCSVPSLFGPPRSRSVEKIVNEIRGLIRYGVRRIVLSASDFLEFGRDLLVEPDPLTNPRNPPPNHEEIDKLLSSIFRISKVQRGEVSVLIENVKPSLVTEEIAEVLGKYLRGTPVHMGCETGSKEHSMMLGRPSTPEETLEAIRKLRRHRLKPYAYFIHGLPGQTIKTAEETVRVMQRTVELGAEKLTVYRFQPLPMSAFGDFAKAPPSHRDPASRKIGEAGKQINRKLKRSLVGERIKVIIAEPYSKDKSKMVAYPFKHGPVTLVKNASKLVGRIINIRVTRVISDRLIEASVVK